jgi:glycosyltransferase involved in cell wall biosynthesis
MKISILYKFVEGPWGGTNQFLKALKKEFISQRVYEENPRRAEVILFNSYPLRSEFFFSQILNLKQKLPDKIIILRLNGPISLYRGKDKEVDKIIALFNSLFVDGIIFQSNWCKKQNKKFFGISAKYETVIHNAPDKKIFNKEGKNSDLSDNKIRLIATSWSSNWRKGFEVYKYLDENLDGAKHEMTFVGNSPVEFKKIKWIKPVFPEELAKLLKEHDIYITASQKDPCSNSLIEALSCGLPAVCLNDGGHPELLQKAGELFHGKEDIMEKIEKVVKNYQNYQAQINDFSIKKTAQAYYEFAKKIYDDTCEGRYKPKQVNLLTKIGFYKMKIMILRWKILNKIRNIKTWKFC